VTFASLVLPWGNRDTSRAHRADETSSLGEELTTVRVKPGRDRLGALRRSVADQMAPLLALRAVQAGRWTIQLDVARARRRVRAGWVAFDPHALISGVGVLGDAFARAVAAAIAECNDGTNQLNALVYETYRSNELQAIYFQRGRSVRPPHSPVTNAQSNLFSWHGYGLAVDVIHRAKQWDVPESWFAQVAEVFKKHGCKWGGDWTTKDLPHFQWGLGKASPSDRARELMRTGGVLAVWEAVGAL